MFAKCFQFIFILGLVASTLGNAVINRDGLFTKIGNGYYFIAQENYVNWFKAYENCRRMGSELITIDTIEEWHAINKYLNDMNIMKQYWTSGNDIAETGKHVWFSNGEPINLDIWFPGQPDNYNNGEHCDQLGFGNEETVPALNDIACNMPFAYICEASPLHAPQVI
ncbi:C-type lectin 37Da [Drosophila willistoni]|nr:C-type lectin 37Da [Drosophila willistoni]